METAFYVNGESGFGLWRRCELQKKSGKINLFWENTHKIEIEVDTKRKKIGKMDIYINEQIEIKQSFK